MAARRVCASRTQFHYICILCNFCNLNVNVVINNNLYTFNTVAFIFHMLCLLVTYYSLKQWFIVADPALAVFTPSK